MEGAALLVLATIGVILATLRPTVVRPGMFCVVCGPYAGVDAVLNVLLFIPIGAGLALLGVRQRSAIMIGLAATALIETLQLALPLGRVASVSDLVTNTIGTAIGFYLAEHRRALAYPRSRAALRYAIGFSAAWLLLLTVTAVALLPAVPGGAYIAQWRPTLPRFDRFLGEVFAAHVSGVTIAAGPVADAGAIRAAMRDAVVLEATIAPLGAPRRLAPIVRLVDADSGEIVMLGQQGGDLVFRSRVIGSNMRLATPAVVMADALSARVVHEAERLTVGGTRDGGELRVGALGQEEILTLHAGTGWLLFTPSAGRMQRTADVISGLWVGVPLFVTGYWTGRRARRRARRAGDTTRLRGASGQILLLLPVLIGLAVVGLSGISAMLGLAQPSLLVWMGALTGIGAGLIIGASFALSHDHGTHGSSRSSARSVDEPSVEPHAAKS
jgi:hypothetical protein